MPTRTAPKSKLKSKHDLPACRRYPAGVVIKPDQCDINGLKKLYGGKLPCIKGRQCRYPSGTDEKGWVVLYAAALTYRNKDRYCHLNKFRPPVCKNRSKFEYLLFHGRPDQRKDRAIRNRDRKLHGLKKGNKMVVHHLDPDNMTSKKTAVLTHCQHQRAHGKKCKGEK